MNPFGYVVAAAIGAILAGAAQIILEVYRRVDDRRGIASAIAGEISGIVHGIETRGMVEYFKVLVTLLRSDAPPPWPWLYIDTSADVTPIFKAYVGRIGALQDRLPERVARFYTIHLAVRTEVRILASDLLKDKPKDAAARIERTVVVWENATVDARMLVNDLLALSGVQPQ